jgi:outer membrane biosynthesis protein TonB
MISARKMAAFMMLAVLVTGCKHKTQAAPPVAAQAPPLPPKPIAQAPALPPVPPPETPKVGAPGSDQPPPAAPKPAKHTTHHKPKPTTPEEPAKEAPKETTPAPATGTTQQAAAAVTPEASSPIGQLSTAGENSSNQSRRDILDKITKTEKGLNDIKRSLTPEEQETVNQIRTFLSKARRWSPRLPCCWMSLPRAE